MGKRLSSVLQHLGFSGENIEIFIVGSWLFQEYIQCTRHSSWVLGLCITFFVSGKNRGGVGFKRYNCDQAFENHSVEMYYHIILIFQLLFKMTANYDKRE